MIRCWNFALCLLLVPGAALADNCESIRARIDEKIKASGVSDYALSVVDKDVKVAGKVVGSCDLGRRQIVYARGQAPAAREEVPILTECKDGTVSMGGDCKNQRGGGARN